MVFGWFKKWQDHKQYEAFIELKGREQALNNLMLEGKILKSRLKRLQNLERYYKNIQKRKGEGIA